MLAPNVKLATQLLQNFYASLITVRLASISISHSSFNPIIPTPDYIKDLEDAFNKSKTLSKNWSENKEPEIMSNIPQMFITYNSSVQTVNDIFNGEFDKEKAIESLQWLKTQLTGNSELTTSLQTKISTSSTEFKGYIQIIDKSIREANDEIAKDKAVVLDLQNQINVLYREIAEETEKVSGAMSNIATDGGELAYTLLEYGFAVAMGGGEVPVVGILIAVGGFTYDAIEVAINEARIAENYGRITELCVKVFTEDQQIILLTNMNAMLANLDKTLLAIHNSVDLGPIWSEEVNKLDVAIQELQLYTGNDFKSLLPIQTFQEAAKSWDAISKIATNIQTSDTHFQTGPTIELGKK